MKKFWLFFFSLIIAVGITLYTKRASTPWSEATSPTWKTFIKKSGREIASYESTEDEMTTAKIPKEKKGRAPSSLAPDRFFSFRGNRLLLGDIDTKYEDPRTPLPMLNTISADWREKMGKDLMRFQEENTKVMVKDEYPVIKVVEGSGRYFQQVVITYLLPSGDRSSFRALIDSETGLVSETWDRSIHERFGKQKEKKISPPAVNAQIFIR